MPRGPKGERRPADVIGNAVKVMRIATGEEPEDYGPAPESEGKDPAAVALGRKGGKARAEGMSSKRRKEIARNAGEGPLETRIDLEYFNLFWTVYRPKLQICRFFLGAENGCSLSRRGRAGIKTP